MATLKLRGGIPQRFFEELTAAEEAYTVPDPSAPALPFVYLRLEDIELRPTLFQPREFTFGAKTFDNDHVKGLIKEIGFKGELDPILVIQLGDQWVCVDGHHRLQAYKSSFWTEPLKCERFSGASVREAIDEGLRRNSRCQLTLQNTDRQEAAWRHVVCDWGSIKEVGATCGVSTRQVSYMRRVRASWEDKGPLGKRMRKEARRGPGSVSWFQARALYHELEEEEFDLEKEAQQLARRLQARLTNKLRRNLKVSARALEIYSKDLVEYIRTTPPTEDYEENEDLFKL